MHTASHPVYQNYSGWDIYRSWASLVALIAPDVMNDIVKSMVLDGQQGGLLPKWSHQSVEDFVMPGDPGPIMVGSAYAFGVARLRHGRRAGADEEERAPAAAPQGYVLRGNQAPTRPTSFIPGNPSETLEYAASDFAIAQFAEAARRHRRARHLRARSQYWRSLFNGESSYIHTRDGGGAGRQPLNPAQESPYVEGNAAQYTWMVPHNLGALITLMGGPATAVQRLDHHFTELNGGLIRPYFYIGNEPEHNVPWTYNAARKPAGASDAVRRVMAESFTTGAGGLPGNDDLGATSAWYVWSALGFYPVTPGRGHPGRARRRCSRPRSSSARPGNITITGGSAANRYVQSLSVDGTTTSHNYLRYGDIADGGTIAFTMGASPVRVGHRGCGRTPELCRRGDPAARRTGPRRRTWPWAGPATGSTACNSAEAAGQGGRRRCSRATASGAPPPRPAGAGRPRLGAHVSTRSSSSTPGSAASRPPGTPARTRSPPARTARPGRTRSRSPASKAAGPTRRSRPAPRATCASRRPTRPTTAAARPAIYELEVYGSRAPTDLAVRRPATADSSCGTGEGAAKAFDGSWLGGWADKWCSQGATEVGPGRPGHPPHVAQWLSGTPGRAASPVLEHPRLRHPDLG